MNKRTWLIGLAPMVLIASTAHAEWQLPVPALNDVELDQLRGGFVMDNLEISIGLEQILRRRTRSGGSAPGWWLWLPGQPGRGRPPG